MFIWMLMKKIASAKRVNKRISKISSFCSRCEAAENDEHLFFHCSFSRVVWFASPLSMKTDHLHGSCAHMLYFIFSMLNFSEDVDLAYVTFFGLFGKLEMISGSKTSTRGSVLSVISQAKLKQPKRLNIEEDLHTNINLLQTLASFIVVIRPALEFSFFSITAVQSSLSPCIYKQKQTYSMHCNSYRSFEHAATFIAKELFLCISPLLILISS
jgi:hypothetical protein